MTMTRRRILGAGIAVAATAVASPVLAALVQDDSTMIQALIDEQAPSGRVVIPKGTYVITRPLLVESRTEIDFCHSAFYSKVPKGQAMMVVRGPGARLSNFTITSVDIGATCLPLRPNETAGILFEGKA
jgi:hypothetical protein